MKLTAILVSSLLTIILPACTKQQPANTENTSKPQLSDSIPTTPSSFSPSLTPLPSEIKFVSKSVNEQIPDFYKIKVEYPQFKGLASKHVGTFNRWVEKFVLSDVSKFRALEKAAMKIDKRKSWPIEEALTISYDVILANKNLISIKFIHTVMALGQTHPIDYPVPVNYDLRNGKFLKLGDLFKPKANYLKIFSKFCSNELRSKYKEQLWPGDGIEPKADNYQNWNLTTEGIMISFDDYQVGPHSMGQPVVIIPYSILKDLIAHSSAVKTLLKNIS